MSRNFTNQACLTSGEATCWTREDRPYGTINTATTITRRILSPSVRTNRRSGTVRVTKVGNSTTQTSRYGSYRRVTIGITIGSHTTTCYGNIKTSYSASYSSHPATDSSVVTNHGASTPIDNGGDGTGDNTINTVTINTHHNTHTTNSLTARNASRRTNGAINAVNANGDTRVHTTTSVVEPHLSSLSYRSRC